RSSAATAAWSSGRSLERRRRSAATGPDSRRARAGLLRVCTELSFHRATRLRLPRAGGAGRCGRPGGRICAMGGRTRAAAGDRHVTQTGPARALSLPALLAFAVAGLPVGALQLALTVHLPRYFAS